MYYDAVFEIKKEIPDKILKRRISLPAGLVLLVLAQALMTAPFLFSQETVFSMPNADVLNRGKVYGEFDFTYKGSQGSSSYTPRVVVGIGHRIEIGLNINGITYPSDPQTTPTPTIKWKAYDGGSNGWVFVAGDDLFVPVQNKTYNAGNYVYAEFAKSWKTKTRATFGAYYFTPNVVASGNRAGGQAAIEQPVGSRVTIAADWFTGNQSMGYVTPGVAWKITSRATWYITYQIGNSGVSNGNHQLLTELGWNFN